MGDQTKQFSNLCSKVSENLDRLLERWNIIDDKNLFSQDLLQDVPRLKQESQTLLDKVAKEEGSASDSLLDQLTILNTNLIETTIKVEWDTNRIYTEEVKKKDKARFTAREQE